jgi:hypothetical protein
MFPYNTDERSAYFLLYNQQPQLSHDILFYAALLEIVHWQTDIQTQITVTAEVVEAVGKTLAQQFVVPVATKVSILIGLKRLYLNVKMCTNLASYQ